MQQLLSEVIDEQVEHQHQPPAAGQHSAPPAKAAAGAGAPTAAASADEAICISTDSAFGSMDVDAAGDSVDQQQKQQPEQEDSSSMGQQQRPKRRIQEPKRFTPEKYKPGKPRGLWAADNQKNGAKNKHSRTGAATTTQRSKAQRTKHQQQQQQRSTLGGLPSFTPLHMTATMPASAAPSAIAAALEAAAAAAAGRGPAQHPAAATPAASGPLETAPPATAADTPTPAPPAAAAAGAEVDLAAACVGLELAGHYSQLLGQVQDLLGSLRPSQEYVQPRDLLEQLTHLATHRQQLQEMEGSLHSMMATILSMLPREMQKQARLMLLPFSSSTRQTAAAGAE